MVRSRTSRVIALGFAILASAVFLVVALGTAHGVRAGSRGDVVPGEVVPADVVTTDVTPSPVPDPTSNPNDFGWQGTSPIPW